MSSRTVRSLSSLIDIQGNGDPKISAALATNRTATNNAFVAFVTQPHPDRLIQCRERANEGASEQYEGHPRTRMGPSLVSFPLPLPLRSS